MSSSENRKPEVTEQMWYAVEDCSTFAQRQLEKLGRRTFRVRYEEQTVHEMKWNTDAFDS